MLVKTVFDELNNCLETPIFWTIISESVQTLDEVISQSHSKAGLFNIYFRRARFEESKVPRGQTFTFSMYELRTECVKWGTFLFSSPHFLSFHKWKRNNVQGTEKDNAPL